MTEQEQKAFTAMREALEKSRAGIIAMRDHAEEYGKKWAACYVEAYQDMLPGCAKQQFDLLVELQKRIHPVADALISSYEALTAANAVSHLNPETAPAPESRAITSESAANAVSPPQATEPAWRPIESAPKDGTEIIGCWPSYIDSGSFARVTCKYVGWSWVTTDYRETELAQPTYWMPLPAAPEAHHE